MSDLQQRVKDFIKYDRSIKAGKNLYNELPHKSNAMQRNFNRMNNSDANVKLLCYELCKAVGINQQVYNVLINQSVQVRDFKEIEVDGPHVITAKGKVSVKDIGKYVDGQTTIMVLNLDPTLLDYNELKSISKSIVESGRYALKPNNKKKDTLLSFLASIKNLELNKVAAAVPVPVKKAIALRDQFPFLRDKNCPQELKALVNDLITARENYVAGHKQLFESMTVEQEKQLAHDVVDNFIENKQAFAELEHYREYNEILGEHPAFAKAKQEKQLNALSTAQLTKKVNSLRKNISTNKSKAEKLKDGDENLSELSDKVADYEWQLDKVQEILKTR
jgi:hypothetical protein